MLVELTRGGFYASAKTIGTTPVQLAPANLIEAKSYVRVQAGAGNTDNVYVGHAETVSSSTGFPLDAGEFVDIPIDDPSKVWVVGGDAGQVVKWIAA